jgi:translation initiation factor 2 alpha subunit (eIF-2alpha)
MELKVDDIVRCVVKSIEGTTVFLEIEGNGVGSMVMSEVAAGRIRNLREYVVPHKKVVCKVLKISANGHIELSLRRVTGKEREEAQERYKKERTFSSLLGTLVPNAHTVIAKIKEKYDLADFFDQLHAQPSLLGTFIGKSEAQRLAVMLAEKEEREKHAKKIFSLKSSADAGLQDIKATLALSEADIRYLGSGKFSISAIGADFKEANAKIDNALATIAQRAKEKKVHFEVKEK